MERNCTYIVSEIEEEILREEENITENITTLLHETISSQIEEENVTDQNLSESNPKNLRRINFNWLTIFNGFPIIAIILLASLAYIIFKTKRRKNLRR